MIIKIKRQDCIDKYQKFPLREYNYLKDEEVFFYPKVFKSYVFTLDSKSLKGHTKLLAAEIGNLTRELGFENLIFPGDNKNYWLTKLSLNRNDYKPLMEALTYFINNKVGKRFNGALEVENAELAIFIKHFFCLVRCDASLPYFHFMDKGQNFIGSICQYGNLHLDTLTQKTDERLKKTISKSKFENVNALLSYSSDVTQNIATSPSPDVACKLKNDTL